LCEGSGGPELFIPLELALRPQPVGIAKGLVEAIHMFLVLDEDLILALNLCRGLKVKGRKYDLHTRSKADEQALGWATRRIGL
jgi:hypothetical protein